VLQAGKVRHSTPRVLPSEGSPRHHFGIVLHY
jgi:ribosomal protein S30